MRVQLLIYRHPAPRSVEGFVGFGDDQAQAMRDALEQIEFCCAHHGALFQRRLVSADIRTLGTDAERLAVRQDWRRVQRYKRPDAPAARPSKRKRSKTAAL